MAMGELLLGDQAALVPPLGPWGWVCMMSLILESKLVRVRQLLWRLWHDCLYGSETGVSEVLLLGLLASNACIGKRGWGGMFGGKGRSPCCRVLEHKDARSCSLPRPGFPARPSYTLDTHTKVPRCCNAAEECVSALASNPPPPPPLPTTRRSPL